MKAKTARILLPFHLLALVGAGIFLRSMEDVELAGSLAGCIVLWVVVLGFLIAESIDDEPDAQ